MFDLDLNGKVALVTGGSDGLGRAAAQRLALEGASVVICGRRADHAQQAAQDITAAVQASGSRGGVVGLRADVTQSDDCEALIAEIGHLHGGIDILINNAGIQHVAPIDTFPVEKWDEIIAINLSAAFHTSAVALGAMRKAGWGRIINISSAHGLTASPYKSAYIAAKHGVIGLTKTTALETAEENITANAICPGYVLTPLVEAQIPDTMRKYDMSREEVIKKVMLERQPSRQFASVEQLGGTCIFFCSDAADQITGTTLSVDGGWTAL